MRRSAAVAASVLLSGLLVPGRATAVQWRTTGPGSVAGALGTGAYVFLPYLVPVQDVSAEIVLVDRVAIGGKALFAFADPSEVVFVPYVALGSPRSRSSAAYFAAAWLPGLTAGTLSLGYEATLRGPLRLYGEIGAVAAIGESVGLGLPYGQLWGAGALLKRWPRSGRFFSEPSPAGRRARPS